VLIVFNRPHLTARVLAAIREARPSQLLVVADGPRRDQPDDAELCRSARSVAVEVDWPCEVAAKLEDENLGCGLAISSGLDWVFRQVDRAIILEDDCVPHPSFFPFCEELLERYVDDSRVMQIAGTNWGAPEQAYFGYSYAFTAFSPVWGWATWRRAWEKYDFHMRTWPEFRRVGMMRGLPGSRAWHGLLRRDFDQAHRGEGTWDHQWQYTVLSEHGLSVSPAVNLITNIGFGPDATQTTLASPQDVIDHRLDGDAGNMPIRSMTDPLRHPPVVAENPSVELHFQRMMFEHVGRVVQLFRRVVPSHRLRRRIKGLVRR